MRRRLLSAREVAALSKPGRYAVGHGAYLQISEWHTRAWIFRYVRNGKARHLGMGSCDYVSLSEARERAIEYRRMLARGVDPLDTKRGIKLEQQRADARAKTFEQIAREYIAAHENTWRGDASRLQWTASLERYAFPKIGIVPVADINVTDVLSVLDPIAKSIPETTGRIRHRIAKILDWAHSRDLRGNHNPARRPNLLPKRKRTKANFVAMAYTALPQFMVELRRLSDMSARMLEVHILTAARPNETLGMRWSEVDLSAAMWTIPGDRMKSGRPHRIPLSNHVIELLAGLPREGEYVFPGRFPGSKPNPHVPRRLVRRMGHNVTVHGFRASFRTWAGERTNFPRELIEVALAHAVGDETEQSYMRADMLARRRQLMEVWSEYCNKPDTANGVVVPMRGIAL
jgi:integrase